MKARSLLELGRRQGQLLSFLTRAGMALALLLFGIAGAGAAEGGQVAEPGRPKAEAKAETDSEKEKQKQGTEETHARANV
jgi:hypothetical protein